MGVAEPPKSVAFDLLAGETREIRGVIVQDGKQMWLFSLNVVIGLTSSFVRVLSHDRYYVLGWAFIGLYLVGFVVVLVRLWRYLSIKPESDVSVSFSRDGIDLVRGRRTVQFTYAQIARVRILPSVIVIEPKRLRLVAIPRRALEDDGARLIAFFEDRLIGKRFLRRPASSTVIVNTATA